MGLRDDLAVLDDGALLDGAHRQDRHCGGLSTAMNLSTPYIPRLEIVNVPLTRSDVWQPAAGAVDDVLAGLRDLRDRPRLAIRDHRHDQPVRNGNGDPDVRRRELVNLAVREVR